MAGLLAADLLVGWSICGWSVGRLVDLLVADCDGASGWRDAGLGGCRDGASGCAAVGAMRASPVGSRRGALSNLRVLAANRLVGRSVGDGC